MIPRISTLSRALVPLFFALLLIGFSTATSASTQPSSAACSVAGMDVHPATDVYAIHAFENAIDQAFQQEKFKELDCLADRLRTTKERFPGGQWKLRKLYNGVADQTTHATEEDWKMRLKRLQHWVQVNPQSATAKIALADAYTNYAWAARGEGYSDSVSQSGWDLFGQRMKKAREILEQNSNLRTKCPQWYLVMLAVAEGEGWDHARAAAVMKEAAAFEPTYDASYRLFADYLRPKWGGEEGDAARFAEKSADQLGGVDGDILYFQMAKEIHCGCDDPEFNHFSWTRVAKGYEEIEKKYGQSLENINAYALMTTFLPTPNSSASATTGTEM